MCDLDVREQVELVFHWRLDHDDQLEAALWWENNYSRLLQLLFNWLFDKPAVKFVLGVNDGHDVRPFKRQVFFVVGIEHLLRALVVRLILCIDLQVEDLLLLGLVSEEEGAAEHFGGYEAAVVDDGDVEVDDGGDIDLVWRREGLAFAFLKKISTERFVDRGYFEQRFLHLVTAKWNLLKQVDAPRLRVILTPGSFKGADNSIFNNLLQFG